MHSVFVVGPGFYCYFSISLSRSFLVILFVEGGNALAERGATTMTFVRLVLFYFAQISFTSPQVKITLRRMVLRIWPDLHSIVEL